MYLAVGVSVPHARPHFDELSAPSRRIARRAFTLIDVLVSLAVVAVLIAIMLPSLSAVREATRRVVCGSNLRQVGLALHTYGNDYRGSLPSSVYTNAHANGMAGATSAGADPSGLLSLRIDQPAVAGRSVARGGWDGLGVLYASDYLTAGEIFYCPSHRAGEDYERYAEAFRSESSSILGNFRFRGEGPDGRRDLFAIDPMIAVTSDAFGLLGWLNHKDGMNILRAGNSVVWDREQFSLIVDSMAAMGTPTPDDDPDLEDTWRLLDGDRSRR
jgi:type II secretory pathway pseudopilin PulG